MTPPRSIWLALGWLVTSCAATDGDLPRPDAVGVTPIVYAPPEPLFGAGRTTGAEAAALAPTATVIEAASTPVPNPAARLYVAALLNERRYEYEEAIELYEEVLLHRPGYLDATERRNTLRALVDLAEELYEQAGSARLAEERILLRMILVYWPSFRDVEARLALLDD